MHAFQGLEINRFLLLIAAWYAVTRVEAEQERVRRERMLFSIFLCCTIKKLLVSKVSACCFGPALRMGATCEPGLELSSWSSGLRVWRGIQMGSPFPIPNTKAVFSEMLPFYFHGMIFFISKLRSLI